MGDPKCVVAYANRGAAKANLGDYEGAVEDCTEALRLDPKCVMAYVLRSVAKLDLGDTKGALDDVEHILQDDDRPDFTSGIAHHTRGRALEMRGEDDNALAAYTEALRLRPGEKVYLQDRALLLAKLGNAADARCDLEASEQASTLFSPTDLDDPARLLSLARSPFKKEYDASRDGGAPQDSAALMDRVEELLQCFHDEPKDGCKCTDVQGFLAVLQGDVAGAASLDEAMQMLWTSAQTNSDGKEFCSLLNAAMRYGPDTICEDVRKAVPAAKIARVLNATLVTE